jgi:hypothetical protein
MGNRRARMLVVDPDVALRVIRVSARIAGVRPPP